MDWLSGGGEMGALMRSKDWAATPLGPAQWWPQSLRTAVSILLNSRYPMFLFWGPQLIKIYNDGYRPITGDKHPWALGRPGPQVWPEIWSDIGPMVERVVRDGEATWSEDLRLFMHRRGFREEVFFTFSYSPIRDESGGIGGMFCACTETTTKVQGERRLKLLRDLAAAPAEARSVADACAEGRAVEFIGTALDITERKQNEERLRETDRKKDEFIAMLAHELRNPLAAIGIAGEILARSDLPDERTRFAAAVVARQMDQLQRLVDDLLDVARAMHGKLIVERRAVDLRALARAVADQPNRAGASVRIEGEPAWARGDPARLRQVIDNLLDNAVKYGGGNIVVATRSGEDWTEISVQDDGIGIAAELLPQLFKPFVQGEQPLERPQGGLGLGLALVDRIVALHGGAISAHSEGARLGSTFTVRLPRAEAPADVAPGAAGLQSARRRVLVIEDEPDARDALRLLLEMDGHDVQLAADGTEGLSKLAGWRPEVALVDVGLPGLDGYEVARRARSLGMDGRLVALIGYGQTRDRERARAAGFDLHLVKPVSYDDLRRAFEL